MSFQWGTMTAVTLTDLGRKTCSDAARRSNYRNHMQPAAFSASSVNPVSFYAHTTPTYGTI